VQKIAATLLVLLLAGISVVGCSHGIFGTEPFVDVATDANGRKIIADTARNWQEWREDIDPQIEKEAAGGRPPGSPTWNEKWVLQLRSIETNQENAAKYIGHILESRRSLGLPELEGYPSK